MAGTLSKVESIFERCSMTICDALQLVSHGVIITDPQGTILFWNAGMRDIFGYRQEDVLQHSAAMLYPESRVHEFEQDLQTIHRGDSISGIWYGRHKDESIVWVDICSRRLQDARGVLTGILISACGIQERKQLEKELEGHQARANAILNHTVEAIITIDTKGRILSFNRAAEKIFGYDGEEVLGENVKMLMPEPHYHHHDQYIANYLETGEKNVIGTGREERGMRKDGSIFPMELSVSEVSWNGITIFTGIVRDISRRRRLENEILEISEEERRRIGQELHDGLGQMLTGIGLISQNIARKLEANGLPGAEEVREVSDLIKDADEYARSLSHGLVPVDIDEEGMRDALSKLTVRAQKLYGIDCRFKEEGEVRVEKRNTALHLYRIAQEAITNAVKHGEADTISVTLRGTADGLTLIIEDNGNGFDETMEHAKKKGLGVHTMQYRAHILGGSMHIENGEKDKTRIICDIPHLL